MTKKEKEALIKHLDDSIIKLPVVGDVSDETELWLASDVRNAINAMTEGVEEEPGIPRDEYVRICNKWTKAAEDLHDTKQKLTAAETELFKLRTVISTLEFAYGRKLCI